MTGRVRTAALILRTRAFQDNDLIVDLLGQETGRLSILARGARKSQRRYGGPLELGSRVELELRLRAGRELHTADRCEVVAPIRHIREDLDRIAALAYMLELVRLCAREGAADARLYGLATSVIGVLEDHAPTPESLVLWEVALLAHLGYATTPEVLAREAELDAEAALVLARLCRGDETAHFDPRAAVRVRAGFARLWQHTLGHTPRAGSFLAASLQTTPTPGELHP